MYLGKLRRTLILAKSRRRPAGGRQGLRASSGSRSASSCARPAPGRLPALDVLQPEVLDADRLCKQTGTPDALIAERLLMTVAARAKRLGL